MQGRGESELGELRGAVDLLQEQVESLTVAVRELQLERSGDRWEFVNEENRPRHSEAAYSTPRRGVRPATLSTPGSRRSPDRTPSSVYNSLAEEIPACPEFCLRLAASLRGPAAENQARAKRAWEIGYWARYTLEGRVSVPRPSVGISQSNTVYVVLRAPGFQCPILCTRAGDYRHVVGDFSPGTISHGFPSQAEAKIYCHGAGVNYPSRATSWP